MPPRMSNAQMQQIGGGSLNNTSDVGLIVYCLDCTNSGLHHWTGTAWEPVAPPLDFSSFTTVDTTAPNGFYGVYVPGTSANYNGFLNRRVQFTIKNNTPVEVTLSTTTADLTFSGAFTTTGLLTPATQTIAGGASVNIVYNISGTTPNAGTTTTATLNIDTGGIKLNTTTDLVIPATVFSYTTLYHSCTRTVTNGGGFESWQENMNGTTINGSGTLSSNGSNLENTTSATGLVYAQLSGGSTYAIGADVDVAPRYHRFATIGATNHTIPVSGGKAITRFRATAFGAGGAGGGAGSGFSNSPGAGGGGGAYAVGEFNVVGGVTSVAINVPAGGAPTGVNQNGPAGGDATVSYSSASLTAGGGAGGGRGNTNNTGDGGIASASGTINNILVNGEKLSNTRAGGASGGVSAGDPEGGAGAPSGGNSVGDGAAGSLYGGAGASGNGDLGNAKRGGAGAQGLVEILYTCPN